MAAAFPPRDAASYPRYGAAMMRAEDVFYFTPGRNEVRFLERTMSHPRDRYIAFDEEPHLYYIHASKVAPAAQRWYRAVAAEGPARPGCLDGRPDGCWFQAPTSVTTLVHRLFEHFDADAIITKMMRSPRWPKPEYTAVDAPGVAPRGMTRDEIKLAWERNRVDKSNLGTYMHLQFELWANAYCEARAQGAGPAVEADRATEDRLAVLGPAARAASTGVDTSIDVWPYYEKFLLEMLHRRGLVFHRTEMVVYDTRVLHVAGSVDLILRNPRDNSFIVVDYKRSKKLEHSSFRGMTRGKYPCHEMQDCNVAHYTLQLNVYAYILETVYGMRVTELWLAVFHPKNDTYVAVPVPFLTETVVADLVAARQAAVRLCVPLQHALHRRRRSDPAAAAPLEGTRPGSEAMTLCDIDRPAKRLKLAHRTPS